MRRLARQALLLGLLVPGLALAVADPRLEEILHSKIAAWVNPSIATDAFRFAWTGPAIEGVSWEIDPASLEWIRLDELAYPRARVRIEVARADAALIRYAGLNIPLVPDGAEHLTGDIPFVLLQLPESSLQLSVRRGDLTSEGTLRLTLLPSGDSTRVHVDPSCAPYGLQVENLTAVSQSDWLYLSCRLVGSAADAAAKAYLRLSVLWDGIGETLQIDGLPAQPERPAAWRVEVPPRPDSLRLHGGQRDLIVHYSVPPRPPRGRLAMGLGPYQYRFQGGGEDTGPVWVPVPTIYFALGLSESLQLVAFDAVSLTRNFLTDLAVDVKIGYVRAMDGRFKVNLMLGGHALGYRAGDRFYFLPDLAQGAEVVWEADPARRMELSVGGFLYPDIAGNHYYNLWLRWSKAGYFLEANCIQWRKYNDGNAFTSSSLGLSVGFPLFDL